MGDNDWTVTACIRSLIRIGSAPGVDGGAIVPWFGNKKPNQHLTVGAGAIQLKKADMLQQGGFQLPVTRRRIPHLHGHRQI